MGGGKTFQNVQALRAVAAISVVLFHCNYVFYAVPAVWVIRPFFHIGWGGVDVFFVISGFIIYTVMLRLDWSRRTAWDFFLRRITRIYPVYWLFFALYAGLLASGAKDILQSTWTWQNWNWDILLLCRDNKQVPAAWTLVFEMLFYSIAAVSLLAGRRHYRTVLGLWIGLQGGLCVANKFFPFGPPSAAIFFDPIILEFGFGCIVAGLVARNVHRYAAPAAVVAIGLVVLGGCLDAWKPQVLANNDFRVLTFGLGAAFMLYALCAGEANGKVAPRWTVTLGNASYSSYLGQEFAMYSTRYVMGSLGLGNALGGLPAIAIANALAITVGLVSYKFFERPITSFLHRAITAPRPDGSTDAVVEMGVAGRLSKAIRGV